MNQIKIQYKVHWCGLCEQYEDTKREIVLNGDGTVLIRYYDHHGPNAHYQLVDKVKGNVDSESILELYNQIKEIIFSDSRKFERVNDKLCELNLYEDGIKISVDFNVLANEISTEQLIESFVDKIPL